MADDVGSSESEWSKTSVLQRHLPPPPPPPPLPVVHKPAFWFCGPGLNIRRNEPLFPKQYQHDELLPQDRLEERCVTALAADKCLGDVDCELVAIFTAHTKDSCLDDSGLERAIECLGLRCKKTLRDRFGEKADRRTFVAQAKLELSYSDSRPCFLELFALFDGDHSGCIDVAALKHILCETNHHDRLAPTQFDEFLAVAGIDPENPDRQIDFAAHLNNILTTFPCGETSLRQAQPPLPCSSTSSL